MYTTEWAGGDLSKVRRATPLQKSKLVLLNPTTRETHTRYTPTSVADVFVLGG